MANISYPASSIIGGVSNLEYAIRLDSQATEQDNCLLSGKYGMCKRPNTNYLATIKTEDGNSAEDKDCIIHPIHYSDDTRILVGFRGETGNASGVFNASTTEKWVMYDEAGAYNIITHFPSSSDSTSPAIAEYPKLSESPASTTHMFPRDMSFATLGDYTFINHAQVRPKMTGVTWKGYQETYTSTADGGGGQGTRTIENDEVFAIWFKAHQAGKQKYSVVINAFNPYTEAMTETEYFLRSDKDDSGSVGTYGSTTDILNDTKYLAGIMAYQITGTVTGGEGASPEVWSYLEATSLSTSGYSSGSDAGNGGTSVVTGRVFDDLDPDGNIGDNFIPSQLSNVTATGGRGSSNVRVCHKLLKTISDLPPRSWEDHTVEISDPEEESGDSFYMRFVNDQTTTKTETHTTNYPNTTPTPYHNSFGNHTLFGSDAYTVDSTTTKLPREGHWEEFCGVGVETDVDAATMPHVLVRRTDGSFIMMEAQGSFVVNTDTTRVTFTGGSTDTIAFTVDDGFSDDGTTGGVAGTNTMALIVNDTVQFKKTGGSGTFPPELKEDTDYFITHVTRNARAYTVQISGSLGGTAITYAASSAVLTECAVTLTTYALDSWVPRQAGDDLTNPLPDLFYSKINKVFMYQNRLVLCTDKEVWFSAVDDPFNLFRSTVRDLLDDDAFGVSPTDARGDIVKDAAGFGQNLVVFTNEAQHLVRALDGMFAAKTVEIVNATQATCDFSPHPTAVKDSLFFTYSTSEFGGLWEFRPSAVRNNTFNTTDTSEQVPGFLPRGARTIEGSSKHSTMFLFNDRPYLNTTTGADNTSHSDYGKDQNIYVYTFMDNDEGRIQSAWTKWRLNSDKETGHTSDAISATGYRILNAAVVSDRLYLVTSTRSINNGGGGAYGTEIYLEYMDLDLKTEDTVLSAAVKTKFGSRVGSPSTVPVVLLDRKISNASCTEAFSTDTTITPPWKFDSSMKDSIEVVTSAGTRYKVGSGLTTTAPSSSAAGIITVAGVDLTGLDYQVGFRYTMSSTMGPFSPRIQNQAMRGRNIYVRGGRLTYTMATEFTIDVTHGDTKFTETVTADAIDETTSGEMYFGIRKHMPDLEYTISNAHPFNAMFQGIMYDLNVQEVMPGG
jgi:hypothetical protein